MLLQMQAQPPPGGCELKLYITKANYTLKLPAASGRL